MPAPWLAELGRLAGLLFAALVLGLILGHATLFLVLGLVAYLVWHLFNLYRLERWLRDGTSYNPPEADGIWSELFHHLYRMRRRDRKRKRRVAALMREFREATTAMPDGAVILNAEHEILWYNDAAARFLGLVSATDIGQRIENLLRAPAFVEYMRLRKFHASLDVVAPSDPERTLSLQVVPYGSGQQLLLIKEVTRLVQLERMRKDFVANASHELRSPLTVISGYLEGMSEDPQTAEVWGPPLAEMRRQTHRMIDIVDSLLELSRLENAGEIAGRDAVDVPGLLGLIRKEAGSLALPGQVIEMQIESGVQLAGSELELHSAFANLVYNAIKYTPEDGRISIRWWGDRKGAFLSVSDTGPGIPREHLPRLTERFYRVDRGRAREQGGSGLGLAIVKHALQRHGARLEIHSEPGQGSAFICIFPATRVLPGRDGPSEVGRGEDLTG